MLKNTVNSPRLPSSPRKRDLFLSAALHLLCDDADFLSRHAPLLDAEDWSSFPVRWVIKNVLEHFDSTNDAPGMSVMRLRCEADVYCADEQRETLRAFLTALTTSPREPRVHDYVDAEFRRLAESNVVQRALREARDAAEDGRLDEIPDIMLHARRLIQRDDGWLTLPDDADKFFEFFNPDRVAAVSVPTGIEPLDEALSGGIRPGELGVCHAPLGIGKSMFLVQVGAYAARSGRMVMHLTFENSEMETLGRYVRNLLELTQDELRTLSPDSDLYRERCARAFEAFGKVSIRKLSGADTTPTDVAEYARQIGIAVTPCLIVLDYADLLASDHSGWRTKSRSDEVGSVFAELREVASALAIPIWTATQGNRDAVRKGQATTANVADSIDKMRVADIVVSLNRRTEYEPRLVGSAGDAASLPRGGLLTLRLDKLRRGRDGIEWGMRAAFDTVKLVPDEDDHDLFS